MHADFGTQMVLTPEIEKFCKSKRLSAMAYSPLLGGAYVSKKPLIPVQYQRVGNEYRLVKLKHVAEELQVNVNAVVLAWMMQSSTKVIPLVTGSSVDQLEENFQAYSIKLSDNHFTLLNQSMDQPESYL